MLPLASVSVAVIVIGVLFIGVVLDACSVILVLIFLTVILVVAVLFTYLLSPLYDAVMFCFPSVVGVYTFVATPFLSVFTVYVLPAIVNVMF